MAHAIEPFRPLARRLFPILFALQVAAAQAQSFVISTIAGGGVGDGFPALSIYPPAPSGVALDASGNLYFSDRSQNRVRKVSAGTGIVTTVAGNGNPGFRGDGGPATSASLNLGQVPSPEGVAGVAVDASGNLYIADSGNHRIRRVAANTGAITTVVGNGLEGFSGDGGPAGNATLRYPSGIAFDADGDLYVSDSGNDRIRKVAANSGVITTVAGNGAFEFVGDGGPATEASLSLPSGIAFDRSGNLYIADSFNARVRRVTGSTGIITTVAGRGRAPFGGPYFGGDGGPATQAQLFYPHGMVLDTRGDLFILDGGNGRVRKVSADTGVINTVSASFSHPEGIAGDAGENLYVADTATIKKVAVSTWITTTVVGLFGPSSLFGDIRYVGDGGPAIGASLNTPSQVALDPGGNLFFSEGNQFVRGNNNYRIRTVAAGTGLLGTAAGLGASSADGVPATDANLNELSGMALDASGNLYISSNSRIRKIDARTGIITTVAGNGAQGFSGDGGPAASASLSHPSGIAFDALGGVYIADSGNHRIRKVAAGSGLITTIVGDGMGRFGGDGGQATSASLASPAYVALDASGNLHISDTGNHRIRKVTATTGVITTVAGNGSAGFGGDGGPATQASLNAPAGIAIDASGNLYFADRWNRRIRKISPDTGVISTIAGTGNPFESAQYNGDGIQALTANLHSPEGIALDAAGQIYFSDSSSGRIRKLSEGTANYQGLWWRSPAGSESGWGLNVAHQGEILFATWFTYDTDGSGMWLVMPSGAKGGDGSFSGALYRTTGPAFSANPWNAGLVTRTLVGTATLRFGDANNGTFNYTLDGITHSGPITRQVFASPMPRCVPGGAPGVSPNRQDLWWRSPAGSESGWGVNIAHQGDVLFATWFTYDAAGKGLWLVMPVGTTTGPASYAGALYRTTGPAFSAIPWNPAQVTRTEVGTATFTFSDVDNGTFSYVVDGTAQSKAITRQVFSMPSTVCN